ncbi:MAG: T9SS type A sorting domain-containing protein, partial [Bacteroidia bacterium]|nr:T9SS type A sorting domain-containing protein [Bacteroidia bacterium]
ITALENITSGNLTLFVAVTEKKKTLPPAQGGKEFWNIFRKFIPDAGGILLKSNWTKGESVSIAEQKWLIDKILNNSDIEIIAFIQDAITKEIYQASSVSQPDIVVGIEDPQGRPGNGFILYPNPVKNRLAIGFVEPLKGDADIRIFDIQGIQVAIYKAVSGTEQFTIDDLSLKQGLYMVHISRNGIDLGYRKLVVAGR